MRKAAENMAVDQVLISRVGNDPILRIYDWSEPSVSFGYFHALEDARLAFHPVKRALLIMSEGGPAAVLSITALI